MPNYGSSLSNDPTASDDSPTFPFEARAAEIARRKAMLAQAMRNQVHGYQQDPGRMVSGRYLAPSWSQNLARLVAPMADRARVDQLGQQVASDEQAYAEADRKAAIQHAMSRPQGQFESTEEGTFAGRTVAPTTQDMAAWAQQGAAIPSRKDVVAKLMADIEVNEPIRADAERIRVQEREDKQVEARERLRQEQILAREKLTQQAQTDEERRQDRLQRERDAQAMRVLIAQGQQSAAEARREAVRLAAEGKTAAETAAHAKERQEISEQARNAQERMDLLTEAAKAGETATGSGAGSVRDKALSIFGFSTEGAKGAAKLKALQAQLLTLTPKLGGATSDADVRNYREAVGQIGDETLPMATRLAAMDTVQAVNKRDYDNALARGNEFHARTAGKPGSGTSRTAAPASATPQKRVKFGDL